MRFLDFGGEIPKLKPQALPHKNAQLAENTDIYGGVLRPHRRPEFMHALVDEFGSPVETAATFAMVGTHAVAFPEDTHWVYDPRNSAGRGTIIFVRDGKLWRLSPRMVDAGTGPTLVGIDKPADPLVAAVEAGRGCLSRWEERCGATAENCAEEVLEVRGYRITYVNECGEESAPSAVSNLVDVRNGDGVRLVDPNVPPANAVYRRVYRSATTTEGNTVWLYTDQWPIDDATYLDSVCPEMLGETLPTEGHEIPSDCIEGIAVARNLHTVVWSHNEFWVSAPKLPHAYPAETRVTLPYGIQFIAGYTPAIEGSTHYDIAIGTKGFPYAATVRDDGQTNVRELEYWYPAASPFGWSAHGGVVAYAADAGIVTLNNDRVNLITEEFMTEREWAEYRPATVRMTGYDQRLFVWYDKADKTRSGLLFVLPFSDKRREPSMSRVTLPVTMGRAYPDTGMLMLLGRDVYRWGTGTGHMRYTWWSKVEVNSAYWSPAVVKIVGDDVPVHHRGLSYARTKFDLWKKQHCTLGEHLFFDHYPEYRPYMQQLLNKGCDVVFTLYCEGDEYYTRPIYDNKPVYVPRRKRGVEWSLKVSGTTELREVHLQKSNNDLQNDGGHA